MMAEDKMDINVDYRKFVEGVGIVFGGVMEILQSLDPAVAEMVFSAASKTGTAASGDTTGQEVTVSRETNDHTQGTGSAAPDNSSGLPWDTVQSSTADRAESPAEGAAEESRAKGSEPVKAPEPSEKKASAKSRTTVTKDDITKIIVRKLKQDRANNDKIAAILKTYGAAMVSELPETEYEAFLTDISAL